MQESDSYTQNDAQPGGTLRKRSRGSSKLEFLLDKSVDFLLIFVGLYAATAVQRWQDGEKEQKEYISMLGDFKRELGVNLAQEKSIEKDLGSIADTVPGKNLGPMTATFDAFFAELKTDELIVHCLHEEFATAVDGHHGRATKECHDAYKKFDAAHQTEEGHFNFKPAVLTPFYRYEVWQMYLANGIRIFRNKELAVKIAEIYNSARLVEEQVADIEDTYNDAFMKQVGRSAATDLELAEVVHDEETQHGLSPQDQQALIHISESVKEEHYATVEARSILELKVERMKNTALLLRKEINEVSAAIDQEIAKQ